MADTGYQNPSATGEIYNEWAYPTNAYVSDNNDARTWKSSSYDQQDYYNFGFSIPAGSTINGIDVSIEARRVSLIVDNFTLDVQLSWNGGSSWTSAKQNTWTSTTDFYRSYGGSTDTWERSWSVDGFSNANFRVYIYLSDGDTAALAHRVDHIRVKVYYTEGGVADYSETVSDVVSLNDDISTQINYKKTLIA